MSTIVALLALSATSTTASNRPELSFERSYIEARQLCRDRAKPIAVIVGSGNEGWQKVSTDGKLDNNVRRLLNENYVCVYVDRAVEAGQRLASDFEITDGPGIVISNRAGDRQAFRHSGALANDVLAKQLKRFSDGNLEVRHTETLVESRISYYAPPAAPANFYPSFGGSMGGCVGGR